MCVEDLPRYHVITRVPYRISANTVVDSYLVAVDRVDLRDPLGCDTSADFAFPTGDVRADTVVMAGEASTRPY